MSDNPRCVDHHPDEPESYGGWMSWASQMNRTHYQVRCPGCGKFKVWVPRSPT